VVAISIAGLAIPKAYLARAWLCKRQDRDYLEKLRLRSKGRNERAETKAEIEEQAEVKRTGYEGRKQKYTAYGVPLSRRI
jgi:hypothetical protein